MLKEKNGIGTAEKYPKKQIYSRDQLENIPQIKQLKPDQVNVMKAVSAVLPFRVSSYVLDQLIDWNNIPDDPIFQLTFPQKGMLADEDFDVVYNLIKKAASKEEVQAAAREIQYKLNPHPAGQMQMNVPKMDDEPIPGMQHKYRETVLFFPTPGQTCFSYCTYCFRWAQFVGIDELKFASKEASSMVNYLKKHTEVRSVLFTGGDPLVMKTVLLRKYIEPLLTDELSHITSIRIGTKALPFWPYRFDGDDDADDLLKLFEEVRQAGRHLAIMSHYSHPIQLETDISKQALQRIQNTGAIVRGQAPCIRHINDNADTWARMWSLEVNQSVIPYYMFVERDTGAKRYFELPLVEVLKIYQEAYSKVSGLARTVRGPSMSAKPGKVLVDDVTEINGEKVIALKMIQGRDPSWVNKLFFAKYDEKATWLNFLKPAFGEKEFFYESALKEMEKTGQSQVWTEESNQASLITPCSHNFQPVG